MQIFKNTIYQRIYERIIGVIVIGSIFVSVTTPQVLRANEVVAESVQSIGVETSTPVVEETQPIEQILPEASETQVEIIVNPTPDQVKEEIIRQAKAIGVNVNTALRIANCESTFRYNAKNPRGSAKGVYQFIDRTWKYIGAKGHQYDYKENIHQFMVWYPKHPGWWECK